MFARADVGFCATWQIIAKTKGKLCFHYTVLERGRIQLCRTLKYSPFEHGTVYGL